MLKFGAVHIRSQIPNLFTLCNLLCGALAIYTASLDRPALAGWLIIAAALLDLADGAVARLLGVSSELGKQLDSLADVISFGLAPAFVAMVYSGAFVYAETGVFTMMPMLMPVFAAYRLARFNIAPAGGTVHFSGMPTPALGLFWAGVALAVWYGTDTAAAELCYRFVASPGAVALAALLLSLLMVAPVTMLSFKGGLSRGPARWYLWVLLVGGAALLALLRFQAVPFILLLYLTLSITYHFIHMRS